MHVIKENETCLDLMKRYGIYDFHNTYDIDCNNLQKNKHSQ